MNDKQKAAMLYDCADALVTDLPPFSEAQNEALRVRDELDRMRPRLCALLYDRIVKGNNV